MLSVSEVVSWAYDTGKNEWKVEEMSVSRIFD